MSKQRNLAATSFLCGILGLIGWTFYVGALRGLFGEDWMVYFNAARLYFEGQLDVLYDGVRSTALLNARFGPWLAHPLPLHPWLYPPHALLLMLPFGLLPFVPAGLLFLALGFAAAVAAAWRFAKTGTERAIHAASLVLCPAAAVTVCLGQNTFLTCALLLAGFGTLRRRPILGGALLGIATYKPQLWLMVPVALIAARQWRALAAAVGAALLLAAASVALFGFEPWHAWFALMTEPSALYDRWRVIARLNGQSVYTYASLLGAPVVVANFVQALTAIAAAGCVWWCHRRPMADDLRLAVLLAATLLAAPHVIDYDALLLGIAATLFFIRGYADGFRFGDVTVAVLAWASPLINPPTVFPIGFVTPLLIALFIGCAMARGRRDAARTAPSGVLNPA
ncbi:MAG: glycosyltransferase family 87 protein [Stellaceae bacterium]